MSKFQVGQKVKVELDDRLHTGEVIDVKYAGAPRHSILVRIPGVATLFFYESNVWRYEPLADETLLADFKQKAPGVVASLNKICNVMFPTLNGLNACDAATLGDGFISIWDGTLTIDPTPIEVKCIGCVREVFGWSVTAYRQLPSFDRDVPPDVAEDCRGQARNDIEVCRLVCKALFEDRLEGQLENLDIEQMIEKE